MSAYPPPQQYPPAGGGYPQQPGYPMEQPGYPPSQPAYPPSSQPAYPPPSQPAYPPPSQPAYPPPQAGYPPAAYPPPAAGAYPTPSAPPPNYNQHQGYGNTAFDPTPTPQPKPQRPPSAPRPSPQAWDDDPFDGKSFNDKHVRMVFIRKVYFILMLQLLFTTAVVLAVVLHKPTQFWVRQHSWIYYPAYGVFLIVYIALVCCPSVRRKWPVNIICLAIFTIALTYMTATISAFHNIEAVGIGLGITVLITLSVSIFACQTKYDFTKCGGILFVCMLALFFFGLACMIVYFISPGSFASRVLQCVYGGLGALLFSAFLAYDTQLLIGGKKHELSPEEHIYASLQLYLDIVLIFMYIMAIFSGGGCSD